MSTNNIKEIEEYREFKIRYDEENDMFFIAKISGDEMRDIAPDNFSKRQSLKQLKKAIDIHLDGTPEKPKKFQRFEAFYNKNTKNTWYGIELSPCTVTQTGA